MILAFMKLVLIVWLLGIPLVGWPIGWRMGRKEKYSWRVRMAIAALAGLFWPSFLVLVVCSKDDDE